MSSSIVEQEAFKASILSHVRAIHGPKYSRGTVFDVVTGWDNAGEVVSADWSPIMASDRADTVNQAYQDILNKLRIEMQKVMGLVETYKKKAEE